MKKLLMMAVVACVATFAQAVTLNWTTGQDATSWWPSVDASALVWSADGTSVTEALKALTETVAGYSKVDGAYASVQDDNVSNFSGIITEVEPKQTTGTYFVFVNAGEDTYGTSFDAAAATTYWYSSEGSAPSTKVFEMNDFTKVAVPEPTALALLALGVAGVALRRRRRA